MTNPGRPVLLAAGLAAAALLLQAAVSPFQAALAELISRRVDGACTRRLMRATLTGAPASLLEQPDVLDKIGDARRGLTEHSATPGAAVAGLIALLARYTQLAGAALITGVVLGPVAALVITAAALVARFGERGAQGRYSVLRRRSAAARRRVHYILDTGSLLVLAGTLAVLVLLRGTAGRGGLSVLGLSLALQAILIALRFGVYFPEADDQTQDGMQAHDSILAIERAAAPRSPGGPRPGSRPAAARPVSGITFEQVSFVITLAVQVSVQVSGALGVLSLLQVAARTTDRIGQLRTVAAAGPAGPVSPGAAASAGVPGRLTRGITLEDVWRARVATLFQDFQHIELTLGESIGHGDITRAGDTETVLAAAERARATGSWPRSPAAWPATWATPTATARNCPAASGRRWAWPAPLPPLLHRGQGRPHRRPGRRPARRVRHPPSADGRPRALRRAVRAPGPRLPLAGRRVWPYSGRQAGRVITARSEGVR